MQILFVFAQIYLFTALRIGWTCLVFSMCYANLRYTWYCQPSPPCAVQAYRPFGPTLLELL